MITFKELSTLLEAEVLQLVQPDSPVYLLLTDSRQALIRPESVFFAIRGERHDGHQYVYELYQQGCRQFVLEQETHINLPEANVIRVDNCILALQKLAMAHRQKFDFPLIGITGSNGKTIVKEWLSQLLSHRYKVVKSPKSYNSQLGVPLSIWQLDNAYNLAVIEAGISRKGEMEKLEQVIQPTYGIFTNIGPAHSQGFESTEDKVKEKLQLFATAEKIIYKKDYQEIHEQISKNIFTSRFLDWSLLDLNAKYFVRYDVSQKFAEISIVYTISNKKYSFQFSLKDDASLENITHCIIFLIQDAWTESEIQHALDQIRQVNMRLELKEGINNTYILDDSYSNDLAGLKIALDYLLRQNPDLRNSLILSDLLQSGHSDSDLYDQVSRLLQKYQLYQIILIGTGLGNHLRLFNKFCDQLYYFKTTEDFLSQIHSIDIQDENILIKGARAFGFERIVKKLQKKVTGTTLEINLDAIIHNLNYTRSLLKPETKLMVMVKAFSYGGASFEIANALQFHRVDYLAVAYADEGIHLREHGINLPIMVLNPAVESLEVMIEHQLEPEIYSLYILDHWIAACKDKTDTPCIHIKIDTGMHRLGFVREEVEVLMVKLKEYPEIKVSSVFSHLVAAEDEEEDAFSLKQIDLFESLYTKISKAITYSPLKHILNSAGIFRFPHHQFDMVRLGIGLYGVDITKANHSFLKPISTLKTVISQIKTLQLS